MFIRVDAESVVNLIMFENDPLVENLIQVDTVPTIEFIEGKICKQIYDRATNTVSNVFEDIPKPLEMNKQLTLDEIQERMLLNTEYLVIMSEITTV